MLFECYILNVFAFEMSSKRMKHLGIFCQPEVFKVSKSQLQFRMVTTTLTCFVSRYLKADSHITCRAHAAPVPFPCHAIPLPCRSPAMPFR